MTHIAIGIATYRRPQMLRDLLASIEQSQWPDEFSFEIIIVENEPAQTLPDLAQEFPALNAKAKISMSFDGRRGIAFVRNRILDRALEHGADYLIFVDDDEIVLPDWLGNLLRGAIAQNLDMAGGPVLARAHEPLSGWLEKVIFRDFEVDFARKIRQAEAVHQKGLTSVTPLPTCNWIAKTAFLRDKNLRFDENVGLGSAEDIRFFNSAVKAGAITGWVPNAYLYDCLPKGRLTLGFQISRGINDGISIAARSAEARGYIDRKGLWLTFIRRCLLTPFRIIFSLAMGGKSLARSVATFARALGGIMFLYGKKSQTYKNTTGK